MAKLAVFSLADHGVNRTLHPLEGSEDRLLLAQNAVAERAGSRRALRKRRGLAPLVSGLGGQVHAIVLGGVLLPTPTPSPIDLDDPDLDLGPFVNQVTALLDLATMRCSLYLSAATTSVPDDTPTIVSWTAEEYDIGALHNPSVNPDRVTIPSNGAGIYLILGQAVWATASSVKHRPIRVLKNGAVAARSDGGADDDGEALAQQVAAVLPLVAGDYLQIEVEQDTGSALNLVGGTPDQTSLRVLRLVETVATPLPRAHVYRSTNLTITADTATVVPFDAEAVDNAAMHDTAVNTERLTIPTNQDGWYYVEAQVAVGATYVGLLTVDLLKNGTQRLARRKVAGINSTTDPDVTVGVSGCFELNAGDYLTVQVTENPNPGTSARPVLGSAAPDLGTTWLLASRVG